MKYSRPGGGSNCATSFNPQKGNITYGSLERGRRAIPLHRSAICSSCKKDDIWTPASNNLEELVPGSNAHLGSCHDVESSHFQRHNKELQVSCVPQYGTKYRNWAATCCLKDMLCAKYGIKKTNLWQMRVFSRTNPAAEKHFRPLYHRRRRDGVIQVTYKVSKYVSCRSGRCASKKEVKCLKVCPGWDPRWGESAHRDRCSKDYCKEPYGSLILREQAMMM